GGSGRARLAAKGDRVEARQRRGDRRGQASERPVARAVRPEGWPPADHHLPRAPSRRRAGEADGAARDRALLRRRRDHRQGVGSVITQNGYEPVIGLEIHVQLSTKTKMFCGCALSFGDEPNVHTCPVCLGHPGTLPPLNQQAVHFALMIAAALDCEVAPRSIFHRKNYFYPDLPKGYQISQYDIPLASGGQLDVPEGPSVR